ncbi:MAG: hypothetical protein V1770_01080 [bacterium]
MKKNQHKEFNIPIKVFEGSCAHHSLKEKKITKNKRETIVLEDRNNDIVPIIIENNSTNDNKKAGALNEEKKNKKQNCFSSPILWLEKKNKEEKTRLMWAIVGSFMVIIIFVWTIFLKYNIMLEKLSLKQMEKEEEWENVKENFTKSMDNFQKKLSEIKNGINNSDMTISTSEDSTTDQSTQLKGAAGETEESITPPIRDVNLTEENIEKLKEKLMEKK